MLRQPFTPNIYITACQASITFTISDGCGSVEYSKTFEINGPEPEGISIDVEESYGYPPVLYGQVWYLCPNSSYSIYPAEKVRKKMKIKTSAWKNDFYYIVLTYKGKVFSEKIKVEK
jgi:hypothetical protein